MRLQESTATPPRALPPELLAQLRTQRLGSSAVIDALQRLGGEANYNDILINIYDDTGLVYKRTSLLSSIHSLLKTETIERVGPPAAARVRLVR